MNKWLDNLEPNYRESDIINDFYSTLSKLGIVNHMFLSMGEGDEGCGNEQCCGYSPPFCEVEVTMNDGTCFEYDVY